jgi:hypothetical protein
LDAVYTGPTHLSKNETRDETRGNKKGLKHVYRNKLSAASCRVVVTVLCKTRPQSEIALSVLRMSSWMVKRAKDVEALVVRTGLKKSGEHA